MHGRNLFRGLMVVIVSVIITQSTTPFMYNTLPISVEEGVWISSGIRA